MNYKKLATLHCKAKHKHTLTKVGAFLLSSWDKLIMAGKSVDDLENQSSIQPVVTDCTLGAAGGQFVHNAIFRDMSY